MLSAGLIRNELVAIPIVAPSAGALATAAVARMVPAPGRFSTTTDLPPQRADRSSARMRATTSVGPPAANGTRILVAPAGSSAAGCASPPDDATRPSASAATNERLPPAPFVVMSSPAARFFATQIYRVCVRKSHPPSAPRHRRQGAFPWPTALRRSAK